MAEWARVMNTTRSTVLAARCRIARSLWDRTMGLRGTVELDQGIGLWIERAPSIDMFFMRYAIDAVFVDRHGQVVRIVEHLRPWRIVAWARGARDCLELRAGSVQATGTQVGDHLALEPIEAGEMVAGA